MAAVPSGGGDGIADGPPGIGPLMPTFIADPDPLGALRRLMLFEAPPNPMDNQAVADLGRTARAMGTLCVIDIKPRDWPGDGLASLAHLAEITMDEIRLHLHERVAAYRRECHTALLRPND